MTKLFAEQPILLSVVLGFLAATVLYAWTRAGGRGLAIAGGILLLMIPVVWIVAGAIETEEEQIRAMLTRVAEDVENNRFEEAYQAIHPERREVLEQARSELPRYTFSRARVASIRTLRTLEGTEPPRAVVDFIAGVTVGTKNGAIPEQRVARRVILHLEKTPSGWKVIDYDQRSPVGRRDAYSSASGEDLEPLLRP